MAIHTFPQPARQSPFAHQSNGLTAPGPASGLEKQEQSAPAEVTGLNTAMRLFVMDVIKPGRARVATGPKLVELAIFSPILRF